MEQVEQVEHAEQVEQVEQVGSFEWAVGNQGQWGVAVASKSTGHIKTRHAEFISAPHHKGNPDAKYALCLTSGDLACGVLK